MPDLSPSVRASDADRDATVDRVRLAFAEGRLTPVELDDRLEQALAARTVAELGPITADLPAETRGDEGARRQPSRRAPVDPLRIAWAAWLLAVTVNLVIWALVSIGVREAVYFWPIWVAGPWGAVLLSRSVGGRSGRSWCAVRS